jgi:hypothetical protein
MDKPEIGTVLVVTDHLSNGSVALEEVRNHQAFEVVVKNWEGKKFAAVWPQTKGEPEQGRWWAAREFEVVLDPEGIDNGETLDAE